MTLQKIIIKRESQTLIFLQIPYQLQNQFQQKSNNQEIFFLFNQKINMVNFAEILIKEFTSMKTQKILNVILHLIMLILCFIGSAIFICDFLNETTTPNESQNIIQQWSVQHIDLLISNFIKFVNIKIVLPCLIFAYLYFCIKQKVFQKLLKQDYTQKYNQKYGKMHKAQFGQNKKTEKQVTLKEQQKQINNSFTDTKRDEFSKEEDQSLNMSKQMVKSMSRSMIGSMKNLANSSLTQNMTDKSNLSLRSSKVIQNVSKKIIQTSHGKDLINLFDKGGKNLSQSFLSASSSGLEGQELKVRIKNKKYYDFINQKQGQQFKKWYDEANYKYLEQRKSLKHDNRTYHTELSQLKRGLQKQFNMFLKEYKQNTDAIKQCLIRFWSIKLQSFESKKPFKTAYELSSLFKQNQDKINLTLNKKQDSKDRIISEKILFKKCSSSKQFLRNLTGLKVNFRNQNQKTFAEKEIISLLSKRSYMNTLLNISTIQGQLFSDLQVLKLKKIEKALSVLQSNKIDIFTFSRNENQISEMDLLEEYDIQTMKQMIQLRMIMLIFIVNKINLASNDKNFKVKMKLSVTYDSGFLNTTMNFFKNKHFAEIQCQKSFDNVFSHFSLKVSKNSQGQQASKQIIIYCKPGIDNPISVMLNLVKEISEYFGNNYRFTESLSFEDKRRQQNFKEFIQSLYTNRRM